MIINCFKNIGESMLDAVKRFKLENNIDDKIKISYSGRLDPMAKGIFKILTDEHLGMEEIISSSIKKYQFTIIKNIKTDSYDILGFPYLYNDVENENKIKINEEFSQKYPPYSSVIIKKYNKPYWSVSKNKLEISDEDIPRKKIIIYELAKLNSYEKTKDELVEEIINRINLLQSDKFRNEEIIEQWKNIELDKAYLEEYEIIISSGGYVRSVANELNSCCLEIERIKFMDKS